MSIERYPVNSDNVKKLYDILYALSNVCIDVIINGGKICQSAPSGHLIYKIDIGSLIGTPNIIIANCKTKTSLLYPYKMQNSDIEIIIDTDTMQDATIYAIKDNKTVIKFYKPYSVSYNIEYIPDEKLATNYVNVSEDDLMLRYSFDNEMLYRINSYHKSFGPNASKYIDLVGIDESNVSFSMTPSDSGNSVSIDLAVCQSSKDISGLKALIDINPFISGYKYIDMRVYNKHNDNTGTDKIIYIIESKICDVPIIIYGLTTLDNVD